MDKRPDRDRGLLYFNDNDNGRRPAKPRRASASPRIRELVKRYESDAKAATGNGNASTRLSLPLQGAMTSSIQAGEVKFQAEKRAVDGLPNTGGAFMPSFSNLREERKASGSDQSISTPLKSNSTFNDSTTTLVETRILSPKVTDSTSGSYLPLVIRPDATPVSLQPYPAYQVFANNAYPLYLPYLDDYLENDSIFAPPCFSDARKSCSKEEYELYGFGLDEGDTKIALEVCGAQLRVPLRAGSDIRNRKRSRQGAKDEQIHLELSTLTKQDTLSDESLHDKETAETSRPTALRLGYKFNPTESSPPKSSMSTASHPKSRLDMFPPLMLLKQSSLNELKSNAIGPRKPPGGFVTYFPSLGSFLGIIIDFVIGAEGSSLAAGIFRLQLFIDFVQLTNLNSLFVQSSASVQHPINKFILFTLPSLLALNFVSVFGFAVIIMMVLSFIVAILLLAFRRMTVKYNPNLNVEGFDSQPWLFRLLSRPKTSSNTSKQERVTQSWRSTPWTKFTNIIIVTLLTILYIPLGKLSLDALVWNSDYWPSNTGNQFEINPSIWRNPADICYTTTMRRDEFNWAYVILTAATLTIIFYILWFPYQMRQTISTLLPRVPQYNEMGLKRSKDDLNAEYTRLLQRDSSPLSFMYQAYKRSWGNYKPLYLLLFKFSNILVISIFVQDNCLWRKSDAKRVALIQQTVLIVMQTILLAVHIAIRPFIDEISNRSELISRIGYVTDDLLGLLVAKQVRNAQKIESGLLYTVYAFTYTGNIYFALANTSLFGHLLKRLQKRIDFSIDVFSPFLHLERHIKRRVWQESLSTLLLTGAEYHMPLGQLVTFSVLPNECPPYLLSFQGTVAERHVENLKIVKDIGMEAIVKSVTELKGREEKRWNKVIKEIQLHYSGPDAFWKPLSGPYVNGVSSFFGKAFLIPFPPTLAIHYDQLHSDQESIVKLTKLTELEMFVWQNSSEVIQRRKWVRMVLRSLDGQRVYCPYVQALDYAEQRAGMLSSISNALKKDQRYSIAKPLFYSEGTLQISRVATTMQDGYNFGHGFNVSIIYDYGQRRDADGGETIVRRNVKVDASAAFGLRDDFEWSPTVRHFFHANQDIVDMRMTSVECLLREYRTSYYLEAREKRKIMSYSFLIDVFDRPILQLEEMKRQFQKNSSCDPIRHLPQKYPATTKLLLERLDTLDRSAIHRWWFLFWDDLWRLNSADYKVYKCEKRIFSPQFPSSIAYTPLPRNRLEELLKSKVGLWSETKNKSAIFTPGLLNQIYFTMEELAFNQGHCKRDNAMQLGVMDNHGIIQNATVSLLSPAQSSRLTGGGTNHNETSILDRHEWPWTEQRLSASFGSSPWQAVRRFLTLNRYKPDDSIKEVWIFARLTDSNDGRKRYEAESRAPRIGPPLALKPLKSPLTPI